MKPPVRRGLFLAWAVTLPAVFGTLLSLIAGTWALPMLWAYIGVFAVLMMPPGPGLLAGGGPDDPVRRDLPETDGAGGSLPARNPDRYARYADRVRYRLVPGVL